VPSPSIQFGFERQINTGSFDDTNVRALEEDDFGFPDKIERLAEMHDGLIGRCRTCGTWWERLPHYVYGYAWYRTEQGFWNASSESAATKVWQTRRSEQRDQTL
jgi:hypothetical protein